jgi:hypothetical protein
MLSGLAGRLWELVDDAVAVLIEPIADLGRHDPPRADHRPRSTNRAPDPTAVLGDALYIAARIALVDETVAVVVLAAANLDGHEPPTDQLRGATQDDPHAAAIVGDTIGAPFGIAFIDSAVTVVVERVAHLRPQRLGLAEKRAVATRQGAPSTARLGYTLSAAIRVHLVDVAIAIVVEIIAALIPGRLRRDAAHAAVSAARHAIGADPGQVGGAWGPVAWVALIDGAIAVVIVPVADLIGRHCARGADQRPRQTRLLAHCAPARSTGVTLGAPPRVQFIADPVTVIVETVTRLGHL